MSQSHKPNKSLFVKGFAEDTTQYDLRDLFSRYGHVKDIYIPMSYHTRRPRGFAYIAFESLEEAQRAVRKLDGTTFRGREIRVEHAQGDRKTPHEMRAKELQGRSNGTNGNRRRSHSRDRTFDSRTRRRSRSRSPRTSRRRSSSPVHSRSRTSSHYTSTRDDRREERLRDKGRDSSADRRRRDNDWDEHQHHHRSDNRDSSRDGERHYHHSNKDSRRSHSRD